MTNPTKTAEALAALFLSAMEWGRDYWSSFSMSGASHREVAEQLAEKARSLAAPTTGALPEIDYEEAVAHCYATLKHAQGTKGCIAFARGAEWYRDIAIVALAAQPQAEEAVPYFNRREVERAIHAAENPPPGSMSLNDGKETVRLPGGTLRRMLSIIDELAARPAPAPIPAAQVAEPVLKLRVSVHARLEETTYEPTVLKQFPPGEHLLYASPPAAAAPSGVTDERRKDAEHAYAVTAFDYAKAPIGSRDWCLFFDGWRAAIDAALAQSHARP